VYNALKKAAACQLLFLSLICWRLAQVVAVSRGSTISAYCRLDPTAPDPSLGKQAKQRSVHNNYMTLPVLFIMISNHYPSTYGSSRSSLILSALVLAVWAAAKNIRKA
jgi:hypothetical protein